ncbi:MAG TPA: hypothetical protein VNT20_08350 [Flavisolibacter sp.]|jgi:hypothetical protein|nr:hypothetical protein [Flavisolibacter sp.]
MDVVIKEISGKKQLKQFVRYPYLLYKNHPYHIPKLMFDEMTTLSKEKNPAFDHCESRYWLAYKNGEVVGRIAAILNNAFIKKWNKNYLRFGWFDFEEDEVVGRLLLKQVEDWAKEKNMDAVHGPLGFTDLDYEGMLIEGFDQRGTMATIYNHPYYPKSLEICGYKKDTDWIEYRIKVPDSIPERIEQIALNVEKRYDLKIIRTKKPKDLLPYAEEIFELINSTYEELYGVVPLTKKQTAYYAKQYLSFLRTDFICMIADKNDKIISVGISMPSLSAALQKSKGKLFPFGFIHLLKALKKNDAVDMLIVGIRKDFQNKGVNAILINEMGKAYISSNIKWAETNPELEDNTKVQSLWQYFDAVQHKRRRCYIKYLRNES